MQIIKPIINYQMLKINFCYYYNYDRRWCIFVIKAVKRFYIIKIKYRFNLLFHLLTSNQFTVLIIIRKLYNKQINITSFKQKPLIILTKLFIVNKQSSFTSKNKLISINISINKIKIMFCCTKREQHYGQIVNSVCLEEQCIRNKNQLTCPVCIEQQHKGHSLITMKKIMPELLNAHQQKQKYFKQLAQMLQFVLSNFGEENVSGENVTIDNLTQRAIQIMNDLKNQVQANNQQIAKMKDIFKNINKNANNFQVPITKSTLISGSQHKNTQPKFSPQKSNINFSSTGSPIKGSSKISVISPKGKSGLLKSNSHNAIGTIDTFSHNLKHPYLSLSPDCRTVIKNSHPELGHRYAVLNSKSLLPDQNQVHLKIDSSSSGNIMIGLCHQNIVKQKDFVNNYGTGHGTYLIGQNGNNQHTAISFHHSIHMMNRKQIVGWNFNQGDSIIVGFNFNQEYIYFKLLKNKGKVMQFSMALLSEDAANRQHIRNMIVQNGLKVVVLLQNVGDQVTLLEM